MFPRQVFGLTGSTYLPDFPSHLAQCQLGVRTCLPLRGSSGLSPDSRFTLNRETEELAHHILRSEKLQWLPLVDICQMLTRDKTIAFLNDERSHM